MKGNKKKNHILPLVSKYQKPVQWNGSDSTVLSGFNIRFPRGIIATPMSFIESYGEQQENNYPKGVPGVEREGGEWWRGGGYRVECRSLETRRLSWQHSIRRRQEEKRRESAKITSVNFTSYSYSEL